MGKKTEKFLENLRYELSFKSRKEEKRRRRVRSGIIAAVSVIAFLCVCVLAVELWLPGEIRRQVDKNLAGTGYSVDMGRVRVSLLCRSISVRDIIVRQRNDSIRRTSPLTALDATIKKLAVKRVGYANKNGKPAISARRIVVESPYATVVTKDPTKKKPKSNLDIVKLITDALHSLSIDQIALTDIGVNLTATMKGKANRVKVDGLDLFVDKFRIDSLASIAANPDRLLFSENVRVALDRAEYDLGSQTARLDTMKLDIAKKSVSLGWVALIPKYSKNTFAQNTPDHADWMELLVRGVDVRGMDFHRALSKMEIGVDSVMLMGLHIAGYKNRQIAQARTKKPMAYEMLQKLPIPIDVKLLKFAGVDVRWEELEKKADAPGVVVVNRGRGTIRNLTNIVKGHPRFFTVDIRARLMNSGDLHAVCNFPVDPADDHWEVRGNVARTDMRAFNNALTPMINVEVKSGQLDNMDFTLTGSRTRSNVEITMAYSGMKVALLRRHTHKELKFINFIANTVLRSDNPGRHGKGKLRSARGNYKHDPYRSFYHYMWRSFVPAVIKTVL